jgi:2-haloacid dehalogenase
MPLSRRECLDLVARGIATGVLLSTPMSQAAPGPKIKALAFDAFPIFDPRPVFALVEQLYPGKGADLSNAWRVRQFEYQWLRALSGRYADFWQTTEDALVFAANMLQLDLTPDKRKQLMEAYLELKAWPEVPSALQSLQRAGIRLAFLSNATPQILDAGIKNSKLEGIFEHVLSTDTINTYKPAPRAYQMAIDAFGLTLEDMAFVAFAGWDAAGAKWFGYTTFWVNRLNLPVEELGVAPDAVGGNLNDVVRFVKGSAG